MIDHEVELILNMTLQHKQSSDSSGPQCGVTADGHLAGHVSSTVLVLLAVYLLLLLLLLQEIKVYKQTSRTEDDVKRCKPKNWDRKTDFSGNLLTGRGFPTAPVLET